MQSQVRINRVPEKVPEKVPGGFGAEPGQVQQPVKVWEALAQSQVAEKVPEKVLESLVPGKVRFNRFSRGFPALGFAARFRKICENKTLRLLGIPPKLISFSSS